MLPHLSTAQRLSLQLRLSHRLIVTAIINGRPKDGAVGLGIHRKPDHKCATGHIRIDWDGPVTSPESHPHLYVIGCPQRYHDPALASAIARVIDIEDLGGLHSYTGSALAHLPARLVEFYQSVLSARDRLLAERDHAQSKLYAQR